MPEDADLPVVILDNEWASFAKARTNAAYEKLVAPGAFHDRKTDRVYCSDLVFRSAMAGITWARRLLKHELGHRGKVPNHDHPTDIAGGLKHAVSVNFDDRAFTRLLRFRWYAHTMPEFEAWERKVRAAIVRGVPVSEVLRRGL